ncbi:MAG: hypothetical protein CMQ40_01815 [Gammaproteobacteria bacterium]|nr:hypothetical protein [Gammaproteobacteria bacterium]
MTKKEKPQRIISRDQHEMLQGDGPHYRWPALGFLETGYIADGSYSARALEILPELMQKLGRVRAHQQIIDHAQHMINRLVPEIRHQSKVIQRAEDRHMNQEQEEES